MEEEKARLQIADGAREVIARSKEELRATIDSKETNHRESTYEIDETSRRLSIMKYLDDLVVKDLRRIFE